MLPAAAPDGERKTRAQTTALLCDEDAVTAEVRRSADDSLADDSKRLVEDASLWEARRLAGAFPMHDHSKLSTLPMARKRVKQPTIALL